MDTVGTNARCVIALLGVHAMHGIRCTECMHSTCLGFCMYMRNVM